MSRLLVVALKSEWRFLRSRYRIEAQDGCSQLYHIPQKNEFVIQTGMGSERAISQVEKALDVLGSQVSDVLQVGTCGALTDSWSAAEVVAPQSVHYKDSSLTLSDNTWPGVRKADLLTVDDVLAAPEQKREAYQNSGCELVDMESFAVARVCHERKIPYRLLRAVFDLPHEDLTHFTEGVTEDGGVNVMREAVNLIQNPREILKVPSLLNRLKIIEKQLTSLIL